MISVMLDRRLLKAERYILPPKKKKIEPERLLPNLRHITFDCVACGWKREKSKGYMENQLHRFILMPVYTVSPYGVAENRIDSNEYDSDVTKGTEKVVDRPGFFKLY